MKTCLGTSKRKEMNESSVEENDNTLQSFREKRLVTFKFLE